MTSWSFYLWPNQLAWSLQDYFCYGKKLTRQVLSEAKTNNNMFSQKSQFLAAAFLFFLSNSYWFSFSPPTHSDYPQTCILILAFAIREATLVSSLQAKTWSFMPQDVASIFHSCFKIERGLITLSTEFERGWLAHPLPLMRFVIVFGSVHLYGSHYGITILTQANFRHVVQLLSRCTWTPWFS